MKCEACGYCIICPSEYGTVRRCKRKNKLLTAENVHHEKPDWCNYNSNLTDEEQKICDKYSERDEHGLVHCWECPLVVNSEEFLCKANSVFDEETGEWEPIRGDENE